MHSSDKQLQWALAVAYEYLNRRERTISEVRAHLERRKVEPPMIESAIETLTREGSLDDPRFARLFAEDKRALEGWGGDRIKLGLRNRGIEEGLIDEVLGSHPHGAELEQAIDVLRRRFPAPPRERRERERAFGVLIRKGYDSDLALDALTAYGSGAAHLDSR